MNYTVMTPEVCEKISEAINEMVCADAMCESFNKQNFEAIDKGDYAEARRCHERWVSWWNNGYDAAEVLRGMGIAIPGRAKRMEA